MYLALIIYQISRVSHTYYKCAYALQSSLTQSLLYDNQVLNMECNLLYLIHNGSMDICSTHEKVKHDELNHIGDSESLHVFNFRNLINILFDIN